MSFEVASFRGPDLESLKVSVSRLTEAASGGFEEMTPILEEPAGVRSFYISRSIIHVRSYATGDLGRRC